MRSHLLLLSISLTLFACGNPLKADLDGDGVTGVDDCDDGNADLGAIADDSDCDGNLTADDCDDADGNSTVVADDADCDGVLTADDCDDADGNSTVVADDADCDGTLTADDCDDGDETSTIVAEDGDCDGALTADDCDDSDASLNLIDTDGDGYSTCDDDCDDTDATAYVGAAINEPSLCTHDADGDGYGDENAVSPLEAGTDCDDNDAFLEPADLDNDGYSTCDGDCDDTDIDLDLADADGDGYSTCDGDCDDTDSSLNTVCEFEVFIGFAELDGMDAQCSGVPNESMYNGGDWSDAGFTWTDTTGVTPTAITVELNRGVSCDGGNSSTKSTTLNSVDSGSHTWTDDGLGNSCQCDPTTALLSWTLSDVTGFIPNGSNSFNVSDNYYFGLTLYNGWSTSAYARVVLTY